MRLVSKPLLGFMTTRRLFPQPNESESNSKKKSQTSKLQVKEYELREEIPREAEFRQNKLTVNRNEFSKLASNTH
jgi:hypothetical protein